MEDLLEYRALEDLTRGWRVVQPNLEQAGLLRIGYSGLSEMAANDTIRQGLPAIGAAAPELREKVRKAVFRRPKNATGHRRRTPHGAGRQAVGQGH